MPLFPNKMPTAAEVLCGNLVGSSLSGSAWGGAASLHFSRPSSAPTPSARPLLAPRPAPGKAYRTPSAPGDSAGTPDFHDGMSSVAGALLELSGSDPVPLPSIRPPVLNPFRLSSTLTPPPPTPPRASEPQTRHVLRGGGVTVDRMGEQSSRMSHKRVEQHRRLKAKVCVCVCVCVCV